MPSLSISLLRLLPCLQENSTSDSCYYILAGHNPYSLFWNRSLLACTISFYATLRSLVYVSKIVSINSEDPREL